MATFVIGDVHGRYELLLQLLKDVPWDVKRDKLVFLGDLIDRGEDSCGVVEKVIELQRNNPEVIVLRGNHEQMMLDFFEYCDPQWLVEENGGRTTLSDYGVEFSHSSSIPQFELPEEHMEFFRNLPVYHEDELAIYVHAGLEPDKHPAESSPDYLMWSRSLAFYLGYREKLCFFGHTPTMFLPHDGRGSRFDIYICGSCVGLDTSGEDDSPLTCIQVETFTVFQAYPDGITSVERLAALKPELLAAEAAVED
jgi:serine/threonine protein phosphatase 1